MIKDTILVILFFVLLGVLHYNLLPYFPSIEPQNDFFLIYACLFALNMMGATLFYLQRKLQLMEFAGMFLVFTTIQLLACMSFALAIRLVREDDAKVTLLHFVAVFFIALFAQSFYFIKKQKGISSPKTTD